MLHRIRVSQTCPSYLATRIANLQCWNDYYLEFTHPPTADILHSLADALGGTCDAPMPPHALAISYKRGIIDNENDSIVAFCAVHGADVVAAKVARVYASHDENLRDTLAQFACNDNIEEMWSGQPPFDSLALESSYEPTQHFDLLQLDDVALAALGKANGRSLTLPQMHCIRGIQRRAQLDTVTDVLLEALDARWSDHCAHTTWRSLGNLLQRLIDAAKSSQNTNIVSMFHDNAGIWEFYDGWGLAIKAETHNGPTAVSAYFGQLTKLGGVLRDILGTGQGADPIGSFEYTATGIPSSPSPISGRPAPVQIARETIRAIKEYGNTFGVPMMTSHMTFHSAYRAKPFALGGSIGVIPLERAKKGTPQPGDCAVLIGGLTGNDGVHGGSGSSAGAVMAPTAVQIGSPLEAIKFREAILELRDADCIRAITDLGAAGINSAFGEMGENTGVWLNLALVPLKSAGLPLWCILLSESQERMALAVPPERIELARSILESHEVRGTVIGRFTNDGHYTVVMDDGIDEDDVLEMNVYAPPVAQEVGIDIPFTLLQYQPDVYAVPELEESAHTTTLPTAWPYIRTEQLPIVAARIAADCEVCNQSFAATQYDSSVQGRHVYGPSVRALGAGPLGEGEVATSYVALHPVLDHPGAAVFATAFNPWLYAIQPVRAARQLFFSLLTTQVLAGVKMSDICMCDNFYTPHLAENWQSQLVALVDELSNLSRECKVPFLSGKDSSAGSVHTDEGVVHVPVAVFLSALGKVRDANAQLRSEVLQRAGNVLVRIGQPTFGLGGTAFARSMETAADDVDEISVEKMRYFLRALEALPRDVAVSGRVIGAGGVFATLLQQCVSSGLGVKLHEPITGWSTIFAEHRTCALIEVPPNKLSALPAALDPIIVGDVVEEFGVFANGVQVLNDDVLRAWHAAFRDQLGEMEEREEQGGVGEQGTQGKLEKPEKAEKKVQS